MGHWVAVVKVSMNHSGHSSLAFFIKSEFPATVLLFNECSLYQCKLQRHLCTEDPRRSYSFWNTPTSPSGTSPHATFKDNKMFDVKLTKALPVCLWFYASCCCHTINSLENCMNGRSGAQVSLTKWTVSVKRQFSYIHAAEKYSLYTSPRKSYRS